MDKFNYWVRIKEMDGSWTDWMPITRDRYLLTNEKWDTQLRRTEKPTTATPETNEEERI